MKKLLPPLLALLLLAPSPGLADDPDPVAPWVGRYAYAGGAEEEQRLRTTIDTMASRFNLLLRGLARNRLERNVRAPDRVEIASTEDGIVVAIEGAPGFGDDAAIEDGALVQRQSNFEGTRTTRFELSEDGLRLTMRIHTVSALLPEDLRYEITLEREANTLVSDEVPEAGAGG